MTEAVLIERGMARSLPVGAELLEREGVHFRVWAPKRRIVSVLLEDRHRERSILDLRPEGNGYHSGLVPGIAEGTLYRYLLDGKGPFPDPASRFQPHGPHGPSRVVHPRAFSWTDGEWKGVARQGTVLYEMHVGTFTPEGTWKAAAKRLDDLRDLGITVVELMPVADFPGRFGWGYDGVNLFAPTRLYGEPDDYRRFVDRAHALGLGVILDVVYNHFGPDGCFLSEFAEDYLTDRYENEWGRAVNFDGPGSGPVREFFTANARYWIEEFHLDGLRFDATQAVFDSSEDHILAAMSRAARAQAKGRSLLLVAENEPQQVRLLRPPQEGGMGMDALWNDDFHHAARVALTGAREGYYRDYRGTPQEFISALKWGFLYQGQFYSWQGRSRGTPALDLPASAFVICLENHDQVANTARGQRLPHLSHPGRLRALTALLLLGPSTPMLFQGQEWFTETPFLYFADHAGELGRLVREGRTRFLSQFPSLDSGPVRRILPDPADPATFEHCKLNPEERLRRPEAVALHRDLLRLRRTHEAFRRQRSDLLHGAILESDAFALRFLADSSEDRLLLVNLGSDLDLSELPDPLLAPPWERRWKALWSSEDVAYGGSGIAPLEPRPGVLHLQGPSAVILHPVPHG